MIITIKIRTTVIYKAAFSFVFITIEESNQISPVNINKKAIKIENECDIGFLGQCGGSGLYG